VLTNFLAMTSSTGVYPYTSAIGSVVPLVEDEGTKVFDCMIGDGAGWVSILYSNMDEVRAWIEEPTPPYQGGLLYARSSGGK
jgi:hypothetical protein